jgi:hypothetical protein
MEWLIPWRPFSNGTPDDGLVQELRNELCSEHVLYGIPVVPVGGRQDCDDVLFRLLDGSERLAVVHLTYSQHPEPNPIWPETRIFDNWEHFERDEMIPEHKNWTA